MYNIENINKVPKVDIDDVWDQAFHIHAVPEAVVRGKLLSSKSPTH